MVDRMVGLRIEDGTNQDPTASLAPGDVGCLDFDLADILKALGARALRSDWRAEDLNCFGESDAELEALSEASAPIPGARLLDVAKRLTQVIDGAFLGTEPGASEPWVVVKAVDSSWWEVWTDDVAAVATLRGRFRAVSEVRR
jgi:hypothetical protein